MPLPDKPSIAVLAFTNMSGDPEQEYFSDGMADDIITELSHSRSLFVIARNSCFTYKGRAIDVKQVGRELGVRYVLEGSVRASDARVRVDAQLIDAETGNRLWAERFDRDLADVFAVQDEVTFAVSRAVEPAVVHAERRRALRKPPGNLEAWESYQRGLWHLSQVRLGGCASRSLVLLPRPRTRPDARRRPYGTGLLLYRGRDGFASRPLVEAVALAGDEAQKAVDLDPTDADAHAVRAVSRANRRLRGGLRPRRAGTVNQPELRRCTSRQGLASVFTGRPAEGRDALLFAVRLDPRSPSVVYVRDLIALSYYLHRITRCRRRIARRLLARSSGPPLCLSVILPPRSASSAGATMLGTRWTRRSSVAPDSFHLYVGHACPMDGAGYLRPHAGGIAQGRLAGLTARPACAGLAQLPRPALGFAKRVAGRR